MPKKRPCSECWAIIFTRLSTEAQNVKPVVRPQQPKMIISDVSEGALEYHRPKAPVATREKKIRKRGAIRSASQPLGK